MTMDIARLYALAHVLNIPQDGWKDKRRIQILYTLRKYVNDETEEDENLQEGRKRFLKKVLDVVVEPVKREGDVTVEAETDVDGTAVGILQSLATGGSVLRKDLKFVGQIGEYNQKDKLTFIGVHNQITEAEGKKYPNRKN